MSEAVKTKKQKKSWFKGLKAEFSKIIWPDQKSLTKETIANYFSCGLDCSLWN